jgi:hypothetical protein
MIAAYFVLLLIQAGDPFSASREKMVKEQIEARGIRDRKLKRITHYRSAMVLPFRSPSSPLG